MECLFDSLLILVIITFLHSEAVVRRCSLKKVFLKLKFSQYSQENTCVGVFLQ